MNTLKRIFVFSFLFITLAFSLVFCSVRHYASHAYKKAKIERPYDVVVVPGVPYHNSATTKVMLMRILWAKHLYDSGYTRNVIFSGGSVYSPYVEGVIMKIIADSLGMPSEHTFAETKAEHSTENAYYGYKMAQKMGFTKIALATDPFQSSTLERLIRRFCPGMKTIPIVFGVLDLSKDLPQIDCSSAYNGNFVSITKRETLWGRWRETLGRRVKEEYAKDKADANEGRLNK